MFKNEITYQNFYFTYRLIWKTTMLVENCVTLMPSITQRRRRNK